MSVNKQQIQQLAELCCLKFSDGEIDELKESLSEIVDYMTKLKGLDLSGVEPMTRVDESQRPLRLDQAGKGLSKDQTFRNAPAVNMGHFSVPKIVK